MQSDVQSPGSLARGRTKARYTQQTWLLLKITAAMWFSAVLVGIVLHRDLTAEQLSSIKNNLPMVWFDRMLRRYGALLPFLGFAIRWWGSALATPGGSVTPASQFAEAGVIYISLTVARIFVYILHVTGLLHLLVRERAGVGAAEKRSHLLSDHLVLGASLMAIFTTELGLGVADLKRALGTPKPEVARLTCNLTALVLTVLLTVGTSVDMFYTARYFHGAGEILWALVLGYFLFQGPLAMWLLSGPHQPQPSRIKPPRRQRTDD